MNVGHARRWGGKADAHEETWSSIIFKDDLVYDPGAGFPKLDAILARGALEEVEDFLVVRDGPLTDTGSA